MCLRLATLPRREAFLLARVPSAAGAVLCAVKGSQSRAVRKEQRWQLRKEVPMREERCPAPTGEGARNCATVPCL